MQLPTHGGAQMPNTKSKILPVILDVIIMKNKLYYIPIIILLLVLKIFKTNFSY